MKNIAVVSLINEHERRQHIDALFKEYELDFSYFDAINKSQVVDTLEKYGLTVNTDRMSTGEVACYLSHYCLWQQVIDQDMPYLMVFEDDIYFAKSAKALLQQPDWLPSDFDVIKLETMYERVMINKGVSLSLEHRLGRIQSSHMGMAGYIVSYEGSKKLLAMIQNTGIDKPIDHVMFDKFLEKNSSRVYQIFPALCIQDKTYNNHSNRFGSSLESEREKQPLIKIKLSNSQKFNRELVRLWKQLKLISLARSLLLTVKGYKKQKVEYQE